MVSIERPSVTTLRFCATAARSALCTRWTLEANIAITMRPRTPAQMRTSDSPTSRSLGVVPSRSALVESESRQATPCSPSSAKRRTSRSFPSTGDQSILKSPVWTTSPASVLSAYPTASGMEWGTCSGSNSRCSPTSALRCGTTSLKEAPMPCSASFSFTTASVKRVP